MRLDIRSTYLLGSILMIAGIVALLFLRAEYLDKIPCPLCILEFLTMAIIATIMLLLTWFYPLERTQYVCNFIMIALAGVGIALSVKHLMLLTSITGKTFVGMCFTNEQEVVHSFLSSNMLNTLTNAFNRGVCHGSIDVFGFNLAVWFLSGFILVILFLLIQMKRLKSVGMFG